MEKYSELKEYLQGILKTAKKLGLTVQPGGGYTMGYDISNLPPYPVGLYGALSIVEGQGARCKLGLTFDQTQSLEAGFNGIFPDTKNKKKKKRKSFDIDTELVKLGTELAFSLRRQPRGLRGRSFYDDYYPPQPEEYYAPPPAPEQVNAAGDMFPNWGEGHIAIGQAVKKMAQPAPKKANPFHNPDNLFGENVMMKEALINEKKKQLMQMMMEAQPAQKMKPLLDELNMHVQIAPPEPDNE